MIRPITTIGEPILRTRATEADVEGLRRGLYADLINDLVETMRHAHGVGIAAPQIGRSVRICVLEVADNPRYPDFAPFPLTVLVNPTLTVTDPNQSILEEGCLSVPGIRNRIARPRSIRVTAFTSEGNPLDKEWSGVPAVIVQHEIDHLDGILITDRATALAEDE